MAVCFSLFISFCFHFLPICIVVCTPRSEWDVTYTKNPFPFKKFLNVPLNLRLKKKNHKTTRSNLTSIPTNVLCCTLSNAVTKKVNFFSFYSPLQHVCVDYLLATSLVPRHTSTSICIRRCPEGRHSQYSWLRAVSSTTPTKAWPEDIAAYASDDHDDELLVRRKDHQDKQEFNNYYNPSDETGAPPFACNRCGRSYRYIKTLNRHMRHECGVGKHFACVLCGHRTQRSDRLLAHIRSQHPHLARDMPPTRRWTRQSETTPSSGFEVTVVRWKNIIYSKDQADVTKPNMHLYYIYSPTNSNLYSLTYLNLWISLESNLMKLKFFK